MELKYIDAHSHLNFDAFDQDREAVIASMQSLGVGAINVGVDVPTSIASLKLATEHEHIWASVGCHPTEADDDFSIVPYRSLIDKYKKETQSCATLSVAQNVVAVGECGLDYFRKVYRGDKEKSLQHEVFEAQIQLAIETKLPLILHMRPKEGTMDAYDDGLKLLEYYSQKYGDELQGTAHFFVGSEEIARRFLDLGFYISVTGIITFDQRLRQLFANLPLDSLLVETDAPFAAPEPHRGKRNQPIYVQEIMSTLAKLYNRDEAEVAENVLANTERLFSL